MVTVKVLLYGEKNNANVRFNRHLPMAIDRSSTISSTSFMQKNGRSHFLIKLEGMYDARKSVRFCIVIFTI